MSKVNEIAGAAKADIVIAIPGRFIEIRRESPGVRGIIPSATAEKGELRFDVSFPLLIIHKLLSSNSRASCQFH